jgi:hypothetical protein
VAQTQGVINLELSGSKLTIGYDVQGILSPKVSLTGGTRDGGLGSIPFNQLKYGCENVLSANGIKVVTDHIYNELVFCRRKFVVVIAM